MKHLVLFGIALFLGSLGGGSPSQAVPRQCVLAEHFTNTSCVPCATYNPGIHAVMNSMTRDTVIKISFHVWWPGPNDPFYLWNTGEVQSRVGYYDVSAAPDIFMDFVQNPAVNSQTAMRNAVRARFATPSPCSIEIWAAPAGATAVHFVVRVTSDQDMIGGNYRLYAGLISDVIAYNAPNGETSFPDVFRDIYPNASSGTAFSMDAGEVFEMEGMLNRDAAWTPENLSVVAFVQNASTREVLQCEWVDVLTPTGSVTITSPNGGETWISGENANITWTTASFPENVRIQLCRNFPVTTWETITSSTANDGAYSFIPVGAPASSMRVRMTGTLHPTVGDTSNANFSLAARTVTVLSPNGPLEWTIGTAHDILWSSQNISGNISIELNRTHPLGEWEPIVMNTANDGVFGWMVTGPATSQARIRVTSLDYPTAGDESNESFHIVNPPNSEPILFHDPLDDQAPATFQITCEVHDDAAGVSVKVKYRPAAFSEFDSTVMNLTGNPAEYAASLLLGSGEWEYFVQAVDAEGVQVLTDTLEFRVGFAGGTAIGYDDGSAESSQWSYSTQNRWAVRFDPPQVPFLLCGAEIGVSALHPDDRHTRLDVQVHLTDGFGLPGPPIFLRTIGSIGNVPGGVPIAQDNWATAIFRDAMGDPITVSGSFYISVTNFASGTFEAFLHDTSSTRAGRSFVYDSCDELWLSELSGDNMARAGNRMIRATGFALNPPTVTIRRTGSDIVLRWNSSGAPNYRVYSANAANGPFITLEGSTSDSVFIDVGAISLPSRFYTVHSSTTP